jgi:hypothetical protein
MTALELPASCRGRRCFGEVDRSPPYQEMVIAELTDEESEAFWAAINDL